MSETVSVPRWALQFIMENANFQDEGPVGDGWPSQQMSAATAALDDALKAALSDQVDALNGENVTSNGLGDSVCGVAMEFKPADITRKDDQ
ncbi:hypothetical protein [Rhodopseudomonas palustris]|uniref:hypothetical protein n=1 Tax=Rhodopseudomonas palustris TaxID=1076 RepID=UPI0011B074EB|nr:hypothetical protein [Rhodopseudomonas palustris]